MGLNMLCICNSSNSNINGNVVVQLEVGVEDMCVQSHNQIVHVLHGIGHGRARNVRAIIVFPAQFAPNTQGRDGGRGRNGGERDDGERDGGE